MKDLSSYVQELLYIYSTDTQRLIMSEYWTPKYVVSFRIFQRRSTFFNSFAQNFLTMEAFTIGSFWTESLLKAQMCRFGSRFCSVGHSAKMQSWRPHSRRCVFIDYEDLRLKTDKNLDRGYFCLSKRRQIKNTQNSISRTVKIENNATSFSFSVLELIAAVASDWFDFDFRMDLNAALFLQSCKCSSHHTSPCVEVRDLTAVFRVRNKSFN